MTTSTLGILVQKSRLYKSTPEMRLYVQSRSSFVSTGISNLPQGIGGKTRVYQAKAIWWFGPQPYAKRPELLRGK